MEKGEDHFMDVLVVEDEIFTAKVIKEFIVREEHHVETAGTGKDAMDKIKQNRFDLIFIDVFLPDCRGYELISKFQGLRPGMNIVAMTGYNTRELELEVRKKGVIYYLIKPFQLNEVKEILDHTLKRHGRGV
jgi:DNA-binding NtrC family response regulator